MTDRDESPSLRTEHDAPRGWIQWKGTDVCMDVLYCACGVLSHTDAEFCYHIWCPACGQVYEYDGHVRLHPLDFDPGDVKTPAMDEDEEPTP